MLLFVLTVFTGRSMCFLLHQGQQGHVKVVSWICKQDLLVLHVLIASATVGTHAAGHVDDAGGHSPQIRCGERLCCWLNHLELVFLVFHGVERCRARQEARQQASEVAEAIKAQSSDMRVAVEAMREAVRAAEARDANSITVAELRQELQSLRQSISK